MGEPVGFAHVRALTLALLVTATAAAHEIGTTQVTARFNRDHTYEVDVVTQSPLVRRASTNLGEAAEIRFGGVRARPQIHRLADGTIRFRGDIPKNAGPFTWRWKLTYSSYALTIGPRQEWLDADATSTPFPLSRDLLPPSRIDVARQYLRLGFTHIVPGGLDHILFVLGIFLLSTRLRPVLMQVTAFTIAHSITLGLTIYGLVSVSSRIVEPMIALSIAYVAIENLTTSQLKPWRVAIVFAFGLLHGMGFAGVLQELGLPRSEFLTALVTFNVGVELGQLTVIAAAFVLVACWARTRPWYRHRFVVPASFAIAVTGIYWTVVRICSQC